MGDASGLRIGGIFVLFVASVLGVNLPYALDVKSHSVRFFGRVLLAAGAGVILGTAFIHMLPEATDRLAAAFEDAAVEYPYAHLIALTSALFIWILESELTARGRTHSHGFEPHSRELNDSAPPTGVILPCHDSPLPIASPTTFLDCSPAIDEAAIARKYVSAHVLEVGIAIHSVIIGLAVGTTTDYALLTTLLIAIAFHQFMEGAALGTTMKNGGIASWRHRASLSLLFALTTPVGVAIGLGISSTYDDESYRANVSQGVLDSVSGGILLYMGFVDFLGALFAHDHSHGGADESKEQTSVLERLALYGSVLFGAGVMSVLGIWA